LTQGKLENSEQNVLRGEMPVHLSGEKQGIDPLLLDEYEHFLSGKAEESSMPI